ncbi:hypothetical protein [uncultured Campylobacter sp.]|uniref:hypothetical protein n=1 Tax=uncultured Campylobacter sp. TaxID=218934 RepID=UPI00260F2F58|nr:hypothetical protein [uncultured Campylobacter sp.]
MLFARHAEQRKKLKFYDIKFSRRRILKFTGKTLGFKIPPLRNSKILKFLRRISIKQNSAQVLRGTT